MKYTSPIYSVEMVETADIMLKSVYLNEAQTVKLVTGTTVTDNQGKVYENASSLQVDISALTGF